MVCYGDGAHLDSSCEQMTVVRQTSRERRAIVEGEALLAFGELQLCLKRINFSPELYGFFFGLGETNAHLGEPRQPYGTAVC